MTEIVNKRSFDADDSERQRRRADVREAAARDELTLAPIGLWQADIESSRRRADEAADAHTAGCVPWQAELTELEQAAIARIGQRQPADETADAQRAELLALINESNKTLEAAVARENDVQGELRQRIRRLQTGITQPSITLQRLAQPPAASPRLLVAMFITQQRTAHATARVAAAKTGLKITESNLDAIRRHVVSGDLNIHSHKQTCWQAELAAAESEVVAAQAEGREVHRALIDE